MKIAARKTEGAWFRTNKDIQALNDDERANLAGSIDQSAFIDAAFAALNALQDEAGVTSITTPATTLEWAQNMCDDGIPHQIWFGRLSWTSYTRSGPKGNRKYAPNYQNAMAEFGLDLRKICKRFFLTRRQVRDVFNAGSRAEGNPGGLPDTNKDT